MLLVLLACTAGPDEETLVPELRVMALTADPPEAAPGTEVALAAWVADPDAVDPDVVLWTCLDLGDGCLELAAPSFGVSSGKLTDGVLSTTRVAPAELSPIVADGETVLPVPTFVLACAPGLCPLVDLVGAEPGTPEAEEAAALLADPFGMLESLPMEGVSLGFGTLDVSARATPAVNPSLAPAFDAAVAPAGEQVDLAFTSDGAEVWAYTTAGGFDMPVVEPEEGTATHVWYAPEEPGAATLWAVALGAEGGATVWRGEASAQ